MTRRLKVPPTRSTLLRLRRQAAFLEQGHAMLERKRELLTRLVYERLGQYRQLRGEARAALAEAYRWLGTVHMRMGSQMLLRTTVGLRPALRCFVLPRSVLGVEYPAVDVEPLPLSPVGLMWTDASFDQARETLARATILLAHLGEAETALWRLLAEQRRMQKRVNALKYNVIPRYRDTIRYIRSALEEEERDLLSQITVAHGAGPG